MRISTIVYDKLDLSTSHVKHHCPREFTKCGDRRNTDRRLSLDKLRPCCELFAREALRPSHQVYSLDSRSGTGIHRHFSFRQLNSKKHNFPTSSLSRFVSRGDSRTFADILEILHLSSGGLFLSEQILIWTFCTKTLWNFIVIEQQ